MFEKRTFRATRFICAINVTFMQSWKSEERKLSQLCGACSLHCFTSVYFINLYFFEVYGDFCRQISSCLVWSNFVQLMGPHRPFTINLAGRQPKQVNYEQFTKRFPLRYPENLKLDFIEMILVPYMQKNLWCYGEGYFGQKNLRKKCVNRDKM